MKDLKKLLAILFLAGFLILIGGTKIADSIIGESDTDPFPAPYANEAECEKFHEGTFVGQNYSLGGFLFEITRKANGQQTDSVNHPDGYYTAKTEVIKTSCPCIYQLKNEYYGDSLLYNVHITKVNGDTAEYAVQTVDKHGKPVSYDWEAGFMYKKVALYTRLE